MTSFDDLFGLYGAPVLMGMDGETIIYIPKNGLPREITAIVDRNPPEILQQIEGGVSPRLVIQVLNDEKTGISSALFDKGGDKARVALRKGGKVDENGRSLVELLSDVAGMCRIEVR